MLVLDNASDDGSADAVRALGRRDPADRARAEQGKAANDSTLMQRGAGALLPAAQRGLRAAAGRGGGAGRGARGRPGAPGRRARSCSTPRATRSPAPGASRGSAPRWRGRSSCTAALTVQSGGERDPAGRLGAVERPAGPARGGRRGRLPRPRLLRLLRRERLLQAARGRRLAHPLRPAAEAVHHDQLSTDLAAGLPRIVEFHRNRDLYMRKHHSAAAALAVRVAHRLVLRPARPRRRRHPRPARPRLLGPRPPGAAPEPRREHPRPRPTGRQVGRPRRCAPPRRPRGSRRRPRRALARGAARRRSISSPRVAQQGQPAALLGGEEAAERAGRAG